MKLRCIECGGNADCLFNMCSVCFECIGNMKNKYKVSSLLVPLVPVDVYRSIMKGWEDDEPNMTLPGESRIKEIMKSGEKE